MTPRTWVLLSDKRGDNGQVETLIDALGWPVERKYLAMQPQWVLGKPRYRPSLAHLDLSCSSKLEPPWPELIITSGRRPSMAALWVKRQSQGRAKIALIGKPSGHMLEFSLVIASGENQMPPLANFQPVRLPFMRVDAGAARNAAREWRERFAPLPRPLIAFLVGGRTNPFIMNRKAIRRMAALARRVVNECGGTPYFTTSRRTGPAATAQLRQALPQGAVLHEWKPDDDAGNPYAALLGSADGFIVTGDSVSMMVEVIRISKPLAIFPLPGGWLGGLDQCRRSLAHWLFRPAYPAADGSATETPADRARHGLARAVFYLDRFKILSATRDFRAFHGMLVEQGLAVWAGNPLKSPPPSLPDELSIVVRRIKGLFGE